jgi:hypothetical protein
MNENRDAINWWNKLKLKWKEDLINKIAVELVANEKIIRERAGLVVEDWLYYNAYNNIQVKWEKSPINTNRVNAFRNEWIETPFWRYRPEQIYFYNDDSILKTKYKSYKESKKTWVIETIVWWETWEVISYSSSNRRGTKYIPVLRNKLTWEIWVPYRIEFKDQKSFEDIFKMDPQQLDENMGLLSTEGNKERKFALTHQNQDQWRTAIKWVDWNPIKIMFMMNRWLWEDIYNDNKNWSADMLFEKYFGTVRHRLPRRMKSLILRYFTDQDPNKTRFKSALYNLAKLTSWLMITSYWIPLAAAIWFLWIPYAVTWVWTMLTVWLLWIYTDVDSIMTYDWNNNPYDRKQRNEFMEKYWFDKMLWWRTYLDKIRSDWLWSVMKEIFIQDANTTVIPDLLGWKHYARHAVVMAMVKRYDKNLTQEENRELLNNQMESDIAYRSEFINEVNTIAYGYAGKTKFRDWSNTEQWLFGTVTNILWSWGLVKARFFMRWLFSWMYKRMYSQRIEEWHTDANEYLKNITFNSYEWWAFMSYMITSLRNIYRLEKLMEQYDNDEDDEEADILYQRLVNDPLRAAQTFRNGAQDSMLATVALVSSPRWRNFASIIDYVLNTSWLADDPSKSVYDYLESQTWVNSEDILLTNTVMMRINDMLRVFAPITKILIPAIEKYTYDNGWWNFVEESFDALLKSYVAFNGRYWTYLSEEVANYVNSDSVQLYSPYSQFNDIMGRQWNDFKSYFYDQNFIAKLLNDKLDAFVENPDKKLRHLMSYAISQSDIIRKINWWLSAIQTLRESWTAQNVDMDILMEDIQANERLTSFIMDGNFEWLDPKYWWYAYDLITKDYWFYSSWESGKKYSSEWIRQNPYNEKEISFFEWEMKRYLGDKAYWEYNEFRKNIADSNVKNEERKLYFAEVMWSIEASKLWVDWDKAWANPKILLWYVMENLSEEILKSKYWMNRKKDYGTKKFQDAEFKAKQDAWMLAIPIMRKADAENWVYLTNKLVMDELPKYKKYFTEWSRNVDLTNSDSWENKIKTDVKLKWSVASALFAWRLLALHEIGKWNIDWAYYSNNLSTLISTKFQNAQLDIWEWFEIKPEEMTKVINQVEALSLIDLNNLMKDRWYSQQERVTTMAWALWNKKDTLEQVMNSNEVDNEMKNHIKNELYWLSVDIKELEHAVNWQSYLDDKWSQYWLKNKLWSARTWKGSWFGWYSWYYNNDYYNKYVTNRQVFANVNTWMDRNLSNSINGYSRAILQQRNQNYNPIEWRYLNARARFWRAETKYPVKDIQKWWGWSFAVRNARAKKLKPIPKLSDIDKGSRK